jgi:hypothetical protein
LTPGKPENWKVVRSASGPEPFCNAGESNGECISSFLCLFEKVFFCEIKILVYHRLFNIKTAEEVHTNVKFFLRNLSKSYIFENTECLPLLLPVATQLNQDHFEVFYL